MFLYLSKLLPLFFYPLGLACILIIFALVTLWKKPRQASTALTIALIVLLLASNGWVSRSLVRSLEFQNIPQQLPNADAIVVLGGATKPAFPPRPSVDLSEESDRMFYAAQLYHQKKAPFVILSGGRIDWSGAGPSESADMAIIMQQLGVPETAIIQEPDSLNTYENAVNVKKILQARQFNQVLLVTSAMHMPRSLAIFNKLRISAIPAPTDFLASGDMQYISNSSEASLLNLLPEAERLYQSTRALKEYVGLVVYRLRGWL
ncbi:YdcF family protein [Chroogloeocystis siderophila]|jgi:uncharacterized SAM-binding protein YcdF (DUF218 family)|uniref:DUF218 domain-containing protein n=1 Tax=Chroogloeocystis siderophila 5.2 s.c.1 TaxID=247279 RepID=A0A1U7HM45_9CHRO|nr:YdcF family protein [Chroogloeocystis siderophila]OKH24663.1 hypothetical protein NIES1031_15275 [Chroogloeocystis siderophila 5.2 s.c.1]